MIKTNFTNQINTILKMSELQPEGICGGCNSSYSSCALVYPTLYYCCSNLLLIHNLETHQTIHSLQGHKSALNCVRVHNNQILTGSRDKTLIVWENFSISKILNHSSSVVYICTSLDYHSSIASDGHLHIYKPDFSLFQVLNFKKNLQETCSILKLSNFNLLATAGVDSKVHIYQETPSGFEFQTSLEGHIRNIRSLDFSSFNSSNHNNEHYLASAGQDSLIRIWKFADELPSSSIFGQGVYELQGLKCRLDAVISGHSNLVSSVQWVGEELLSCSHDFSVVLWHEEKSSRTWMAKVTLGQLGGNKNIFLGAVGSAGRILAYTYTGGFYHWMLDGDSWTSRLAPTGHKDEVTDLVVCDRHVFTCSLDQTCRLWTCNPQWLESSRPMVHGYDINCITLCQGKLVSAADEKILRVFEPSSSTAEILQAIGIDFEGFLRGSSQVLGLTTKSTNESEFDFKTAKVTEDLLNSYTLWPESYKLYGHGYEVCAVDACGDLVASACKSRTKEHSTVFVWDLVKKTRIQSLEFHTLGVIAIAFNHKGSKLVTGSRDLFWCLYEKGNDGFELKVSLKAHARIIYTCSWSPDDQFFATGSRDKKLKIWDENGQEVDSLHFDAGVTASAWLSPDIVVVGLENGEISLNRWKTKESFVKVSHGGVVNKLKVHEGKIFSISADHTLRVYRLV